MADKVTVTINDPARMLRALEAVKHAECKNRARESLFGVCFHWADGKLVVEATDGHRLASVFLPDLEISGTIVKAVHRIHDTKLAIAQCKAAMVANEPVKLNVEPLAVGVWPDFEKVVPKCPEPGEPTFLNPKYLAEALTAAAKFGKKALVTPNEKMGPWQVSAFEEHDSNDSFAAVIMPIRG